MGMVYIDREIYIIGIDTHTHVYGGGGGTHTIYMGGMYMGGGSILYKYINE